MPAARTSAGSAPWIGRPSNTMRPRVGASRPETARSVDVLPAPLAPITQTSSPGYTTRSRPRRTATGPYAAWRSSRLSNGARSDTAIDGPQVGADDVRVRLDRGGRALRDHAAVVQHDHGVRDGHDHPHVVLDQEDGGALVTDSTDQVGHRRLLGGGHAGAGLVEEEEPWPGPERHRELHEPLLPVRELARPLGAAMAEAHEVDDPVGVSAEPRLLGGEAAAAEGLSPVSGPPSYSIRPRVGARYPVIALKAVVFPAPFGPITLVIVPGWTSKDTPASAATPPKLTARSRMVRVMTRAGSGGRRWRGRCRAGGRRRGGRAGRRRRASPPATTPRRPATRGRRRDTTRRRQSTCASSTAASTR